MEVRNALRSAGYGILPRATGAAVLVLPRQQKGRTMLDLCVLSSGIPHEYGCA
jgi:hypothetical protein